MSDLEQLAGAVGSRQPLAYRARPSWVPAAASWSEVFAGFRFGLGFWLAGLCVSLLAWLLVVVVVGVLVGSALSRSAVSPAPSPFLFPPSHR
jgi:hypothetical protein